MRTLPESSPTNIATSLAPAFLERMRSSVRPLRYAGLVLFAIVAWKVFFVDLKELDQFYKIIAFIFVGGLALCGSLLYLKFQQTTTAEDEPAPDEPAPDAPKEPTPS